MKKFLFLSFILLFGFTLKSQDNNSNWTFVGPKSENLQNGNEFETSRLNKIAVDPLNEQNIAAAGFFAGLWISRNGTDTWNSLPTHNITFGHLDVGFNGVAAIAFNKNHELYLANLFQPIQDGFAGLFDMNTTKLYRFDYSNPNEDFIPLGDIPNNGKDFLVYKILIHPDNDNKVFVGTSIGLFKSNDGGTSWGSGPIVSHVIRDIEVGKNGYGQTVFYLSGTKVSESSSSISRRKFEGEPLLLRSVDGINFNEIINFKSSFQPTKNQILMDVKDPNSVPIKKYQPEDIKFYCPEICFTKLNNVMPLGKEVLFIYTSVLTGMFPGDYKGRYSLQRFEYSLDDNSYSISQVDIINDIGNDHTPQRLSVNFDETNGRVFYGGVKLRSIPHDALYVNSPSAETYNTSSLRWDNTKVHDDIQDIFVTTSEKLFVACDGGVNVTQLNAGNAPNYIFEAKNYGLNVALINGFSGASNDPNYYLIGLQDIVHTQLYDHKIQKNRYTPHTHENDGGIISSKNNDLIIADKNSYDENYYVSIDGGKNLNNLIGQYSKGKFGANRFFQDPFRDRIYYGLGVNENNWTIWGLQLAEFDKSIPPHGQFKTKVTFPKCDYILNDPYNIVIGMTFSRKNKNKIHVLGSNNPYEGRGSSIFKYIGSDFDGIESGLNECYDGSKKQWKIITPDWLTMSNLDFNFNTSIDRKEIFLTSMVSSNWNDDVIYVALKEIPSYTGIKVIKFDGTKWTDYSTGIPEGESISSMSMDLESNDAIYAVTNNYVYYRDASMPSWQKFDTHWPKTLVKQTEINQLDRTFRAGTYGKGIWKTPLVCPTNPEITEIVLYYDDKYIEAKKINSSSLVSNGRRIVYKASEKIILNPGFQSAIGSDFTALISPCEINQTGNRIATITKTNNLEQITTLNQSNFKVTKPNNTFSFEVFPNPSNGKIEINISALTENTTLDVYDTFGKKAHTEMLYQNNNRFNIDLSHLNRGLYVLMINSVGKTYTKKIVLN